MYNTLLIKQQLHNRSPITQHVDNSEAVDASNNTIYTQRQAIASEADIILAIHALRAKLADDGRDIKIQWIKAHQDDDCPSYDLSPPLTTQCGYGHCVQTITDHNDVIASPTPYPGSGTMLIINDQWITTKYNEQIRDAMPATTHRTYFTTK